MLASEDFIVDKLARPDRGVVDEQDVKSVLVRQAGKLDNECLTKKEPDKPKPSQHYKPSSPLEA